MVLECARTEKGLLVKKQLRKQLGEGHPVEVLQGSLCLAPYSFTASRVEDP